MLSQSCHRAVENSFCLADLTWDGRPTTNCLELPRNAPRSSQHPGLARRPDSLCNKACFFNSQVVLCVFHVFLLLLGRSDVLHSTGTLREYRLLVGFFAVSRCPSLGARFTCVCVCLQVYVRVYRCVSCVCVHCLARHGSNRSSSFDIEYGDAMLYAR